MELQWNSTPWEYLKTNVRQIQNQEQTLEVRISDGMPDIGRVICAWGQPMLRSKEWRNDGMSITGGVIVSVLYAPEDGSALQSVEAWLPFQGKWNFSDSRREGTIQANVLLRNVDARTLSARKLMVRANIGMMGWAMEPERTEVFNPGELPEQVYALTKCYPVTIPVEAGEKMVSLEETFPISSPISKLLSCQIRPVLTEQTVAGCRVVFRGNAYVDALCMDESSNVVQYTWEMPFAQFGDLEREYEQEATASIAMAVSNLEPERTENGIRIKCNLIAQYIIHQKQLLQVAEDAYSPMRKVTPRMEKLTLPTILESRSEYVDVSDHRSVAQAGLFGSVFLPDHPTMYREGDQVMLELPGTFGVLYEDENGLLQWDMQAWSGCIRFPVAQSGKVEAIVEQVQNAQVCPAGNGVQMDSRLRLNITTSGQLEIPMVCGLEMGEMIEADPSRPSLVLQRMGENSLWEMAKAAGSTVEAIWQANGLQEEPAPGQMLLVPVL